MSSKTVLLITGGNTGLGYQIVRALCDSQTEYEILLGGRSMDKARKAVEDVLQEFPSAKATVSPIQIDIEDDQSIETAVSTVQQKFGRVDVLINNAGA